ncbi:hypothetical protein [uncultured Sulfitobacter sp.]|uniref:MotE family protein n=1 Tax=uncultured Sulfitobacter sp. TaxID=191468 RepID=UPI00262855E8|nr:hypothetical protein [uncultured Sulfitobacter sp.]
MKKILVPSGRGSVTVIAILLLSSASIRMLTSGNEAFAQGGQLPTTPMPASETPASTEITANKAPRTPFSTSSLVDDGEMSALIAALTEREAQISQREKKLEMRLQALSIADGEIEKRLETLRETEQNLRATLSLADEASEKDLLNLTTVYENMKPKEAAELFEQMEPNFAAGFLGRMRPEAAASVLAGLSPQVAYSISVILAGRNANVPKT